MPAGTGGHDFVVEARSAADQCERTDGQGDGIGREGVIVYEVFSELNVPLRTTQALQVGQSYSNAAEGLDVRVESLLPGGARVRVSRAEQLGCARA